MNLLSLFSGIGAFEKALTRIGVDFNLVNYCEIDKYASCAYSAIHDIDESKNLWDVSNIDVNNLPQIDMITHGSPCQDFSIAGSNNGGEEGSGTKSSMMWYTVNIVENTNPKIVVWENVPNVLSKKNKPVFDKYIKKMNDLGYFNYVEKLNSIDFGIPQNRERVFVISMIKNTFELQKKHIKCPILNDILDHNVSEKYNLSEKAIDYMSRLRNGRPRWEHHVSFKESYACTLTANMYKGVPYGVIQSKEKKYHPRFFTPLECWRLMGFDDDDYYKAKQALMDMFYNGQDRTKSQMYKMAGNSIVVNVLENIFKGVKWSDFK